MIAGLPKRYYRKVIKIKAEDSPNVRYAQAQIAAGKEPTDEVIVPGVLTWGDYVKRRLLWDKIRQCIGLDAEFYEGAEVRLFPPDWLDRAERYADSLKGRTRHASHIGCDPAEGGDSSCWSVIDEYGLIYQLSMKTPDTNMIPRQTLALMLQYKVAAENVLFDQGGGGKQHADRMRADGHNVRTVAFGEAASSVNRYRMRTRNERKEEVETRYVFRNRRAEMYGLLRQLIDPVNDPDAFGLPREYGELRRQLSPIPLVYDGEGRLELPPKTRRVTDKEGTKVTLVDLIGCSPDEADSLALAVFGLMVAPSTHVIRSMA